MTKEAHMKTNQLTKLGSVSIGDRFIYRTAEILGPFQGNDAKVPFEGQMLTVVDFRPYHVNQVVVRDSNGKECLLRLWMVEKALGRLSDEQTTEIGELQHLSASEIADGFSVLHNANSSLLRRVQVEISRVLQQRDRSIGISENRDANQEDTLDAMKPV
jgi:hypothetical protein